MIFKEKMMNYYHYPTSRLTVKLFSMFFEVRLFTFFFFAVRGPLTAVAFPVAEHRLRTCRLSGHGSQAQPPRGMWDLPGPGHEPVFPASAGGLSTTAPPGKPQGTFLSLNFIICPIEIIVERAV